MSTTQFKTKYQGIDILVSLNEKTGNIVEIKTYVNRFDISEYSFESIQEENQELINKIMKEVKEEGEEYQKHIRQESRGDLFT